MDPAEDVASNVDDFTCQQGLDRDRDYACLQHTTPRKGDSSET